MIISAIFGRGETLKNFFCSIKEEHLKKHYPNEKIKNFSVNAITVNDLLEKVKSSHTVLTKKSELESFNYSNKGKVVGLFADEALRDIDTPENHSFEPTSSEMLDFAINRSEHFNKNGCTGFFVMVEGSQVDWAGHANDINYLEREMKDFDEAVNTAMDYASNNQETLVIVTADHETGGLLIEPATPTDYTAPEVKFSFNTAISNLPK